MQIGEMIGARYRVLGKLGAGAMGVVVRARDTHLEREVAVKLLGAHYCNAEAAKRLQREALTAGQLGTAHVARVLDAGESNGRPYVVMELLRGADLATEVLHREGGRVGWAEAVSWYLQAALGLLEAHAAGIVHRDVKPANIFLSRTIHGEAIVKVCDFGMASLRALPGRDTELPPLPDESAFAGTKLYMAPEQWSDARTVDARADAWSLAVTLFETFAGCVPFDGHSWQVLCANVCSGKRARLQDCRADSNQNLEGLFDSLLHPDRACRYTFAEAAEALREYADSQLVAKVIRSAQVARLRFTARHGASGQAIEQAEELVARDPADVACREIAADLHAEVARAEFTAGRDATAWAHAERAHSLAPRAHRELARQIRERHCAGDHDGIAQAVDLLCLQPELAAQRVAELAGEAVVHGELSRAERLSNAAVELDPSAASHVLRAECHEAAGRLTEAEADLTMALDLVRGGQSLGHGGPADLARGIRESDRGRRQVRGAVVGARNHHEALTFARRAVVRAKLGDAPGAQNDSDAALAVEPTMYGVLTRRIEVLAMLRQTAAAADLLGRVLDGGYTALADDRPALEQMKRRLEAEPLRSS